MADQDIAAAPGADILAEHFPQRYRFLQRVTYESSDTFAKADWAGIRGVWARCQAAGGQGGGAATTGAGAAAEGGGGGSGQYREAWIDAEDLGTTETVTVGAAGSGAAAGANGNNAADTSFGSHVVADGGLGGAAGPATTTNNQNAGGTGGVGGSFGASAQYGLQVDGENGDHGIVRGGLAEFRGWGSRSHLGPATPPPHSFSTDGTDAAAFGAGGSGARNGASQVTARAGGDGGPAVVIVDIYV